MLNKILNIIQKKTCANWTMFEIFSSGSIGLDRVIPTSFRDARLFQLSWNIKQNEKAGGIVSFLRESDLLFILTAPVIWSVIIPLALLDFIATLYQNICFPVYGIEQVERSDFIIFDRHKLKYLNWLEKLNCTYCSYGNGVLAYVTEIASKTEEYWCQIKNSKRLKNTHVRYEKFAEFGDAEGYYKIKNASDAD
ncbi:MAG: hypothetical protein H7836_15035 [Magnetococcus sp. YQC-3]